MISMATTKNVKSPSRVSRDETKATIIFQSINYSVPFLVLLLPVNISLQLIRADDTRIPILLQHHYLTGERVPGAFQRNQIDDRRMGKQRTICASKYSHWTVELKVPAGRYLVHLLINYHWLCQENVSSYYGKFHSKEILHRMARIRCCPSLTKIPIIFWWIFLYLFNLADLPPFSVPLFLTIYFKRLFLLPRNPFPAPSVSSLHGE